MVITCAHDATNVPQAVHTFVCKPYKSTFKTYKSTLKTSNALIVSFAKGGYGVTENSPVGMSGAGGVEAVGTVRTRGLAGLLLEKAVESRLGKETAFHHRGVQRLFVGGESAV